MKDFSVKYTNYTALSKCPKCDVKVEMVLKDDGEYYVILEHKRECEDAYLNEDLRKCKRFPVTEEEIEVIRKFKMKKYE